MKSTHYANAINDVTTGKALAYDHPTPGTVWVALFLQSTGTLGPDSTLVEPSGGGYARKALTGADWLASAARRSVISGDKTLFVSVGVVADGTNPVVGIALFDAAAAGNWLEAEVFANGQTYTIAGGQTVKIIDGTLIVVEA